MIKVTQTSRSSETTQHEDDIITLDDHRPHDVHHAVCTSCGHNWTAVVDARHEGMLECPACGGMVGAALPLSNIKQFESVD